MLTLSPTQSPLYSPRGAYRHERAKITKARRPAVTKPTPSSASRPKPQQRKPLGSPPLADLSRRPRSQSTSSKRRRIMVNATTQTAGTPPPASQTPINPLAGLKIEESPQDSGSSASSEEIEQTRPLEPAATAPPDSHGKAAKPHAHTPTKRHAEDSAGEAEKQDAQDLEDSPTKKSRPDNPEVRILPLEYEHCDTRDLVVLISSMIMELIRYNDAIPLKDGSLTRFHSRAPPGISVHDYLQRLTTHATLSPPILLSMVYYIDRLCAMYPAFTITSLTVHRFLIASGTVASKGLSDSFWTNKTYARVGGVSIKELALLELEFLTRLDWRIVPKPEVLCDYYVSLVKRSDTHKLEESGEGDEKG